MQTIAVEYFLKAGLGGIEYKEEYHEVAKLELGKDEEVNMKHPQEQKFSEAEADLFAEISSYARAKPKKFHDAGKWLDKCCSEEGYRNCVKDKIKQIGEKRQTIGEHRHEREKKSLEAKIENGRVSCLLSRFGEIQKELFGKYRNEDFFSLNVAKRIILIAWLLSDPDAEQKNLGITELEKWPWEPVDDVTKMSRGFASVLFMQNRSNLTLVRKSWEKVSGIYTGGIVEWLKNNYKWLVPTSATVVIAACAIVGLIQREASKTPQVVEPNGTPNVQAPKEKPSGIRPVAGTDNPPDIVTTPQEPNIGTPLPTIKPKEKIRNPTHYQGLDEKQIKNLISEQFDKGDVNDAIRGVSFLENAGLKDEEYASLIIRCIDKQMFDKAKEILGLIRSNELKQQYRELIDGADRKQ